MLKARVIPCLDVKDGRVVKGVNFVDLVDAGDPVESAAAYDAAGADERRGLVRRDHGFGTAGEARYDAGEVGHGGMMDGD